MRVVETDILIVGAGPAGLAAAATVARYGANAITVTKFSGTANSPRAHITNQRTVEIFRDFGIEESVMAEAMPQDLMGTQVFATSFSGMELSRMMTWGAGDDRHGEYVTASPTSMCNAPQHMLEPLILQAARGFGADVRFNTELVEIRQADQHVHARVTDRTTGEEYLIRARYAVGCDGARSTVAEQIGFEVDGTMGWGDAYTVWLEADLSRYTKHRSGALFFICEPGSEIQLSAWTCVKPWTEWNPLFIRHGNGEADITEDAVMRRIRSAIGDPSIDVKIKKISGWKRNHAVVVNYRQGRVFVAGDAAHRHPPANGLGSNTSIQDAYNIGWKLALVVKGIAGDHLLDSYNAERQPVGRQVVDRANKSVKEVGEWLSAVGLKPGQTVDEALANLDELYGAGEIGAERRTAMLSGLETMNWQFNALGVELGQRYTSDAVVGDGTPFPPYDCDPELHYHRTTHPGAFLPHAWLERDGEKISTIDLARGARFSILTGVGGDAWAAAAEQVGEELGIEIVAHTVGLRQTNDDTFGHWTKLREVGDAGCILVRPDGYVGWRSKGPVEDPVDALRRTMRQILALSAA